jgi:hypothetical protein
MGEDTATGMDVIITPNLKSGKLRGINYSPGFCVVQRGETVRFRAEAIEGQHPSVLIVFPNGTPFKGASGTAKFIVRTGDDGPKILMVDPEAASRSYHYIVGMKVGDQALIDGGCPEIFVDI